MSPLFLLLLLAVVLLVCVGSFLLGYAFALGWCRTALKKLNGPTATPRRP